MKSFRRSRDWDIKRDVITVRISNLVATDRNGGSTIRVAKVGKIDAESIQNTIGGRVITDDKIFSS